MPARLQGSFIHKISLNDVGTLEMRVLIIEMLDSSSAKIPLMYNKEALAMALSRGETFRDIDRFLQQFWVSPEAARDHSMPMDAYRKGDSFLICVDLPGVDPDKIELTVENSVLTIKAERQAPTSAGGVERIIAERPHGRFSRQVFLGTNLDAERINAEYEAGVLSVIIPIAEHAKPRRIDVTSRRDQQVISA